MKNIINTINKASKTNSRFAISDFKLTKLKVLNWAKRFGTFCFLDNHQYSSGQHSVECLLAAGIKQKLDCNSGNALDQLREFMGPGNKWLFGHLAYDLKNEIEQLSSSHPDGIGFSDLFFFEPESVISLSENEIQIHAENPDAVWNAILGEILPESTPANSSINIQNRVSKDEYIAIVNRLKDHILRGDCYEINFCQEFYNENVQIDPFAVYEKLSALSPNPFSALYKVEDQWLICASPERFIKKKGHRILSQPIKGTLKREQADGEKNLEDRKKLFESSKDRSENVMVVDLVRNDLAKICREGSVVVDELYGIYDFPQVYQMISTVSGDLKENVSFTDIVKATFPMGSMTGAPKRRVMQLIERYEKTKRSVFSGALGYISPDGDFDFNVVIRSILYNEKTNYLSFPAGSAITFYSDPEKEWEECLLKVEAIRKVLGGMN